MILQQQIADVDVGVSAVMEEVDVILSGLS